RTPWPLPGRGRARAGAVPRRRHGGRARLARRGLALRADRFLGRHAARARRAHGARRDARAVAPASGGQAVGTWHGDRAGSSARNAAALRWGMRAALRATAARTLEAGGPGPRERSRR